MHLRQPFVWLGLSGGVDSAVAGLLLRRRGVRCVGVFMKVYSEDAGGPCPWQADQESAAAVAAWLRIPFLSVNFEREYRQRVLAPFFDAYRHGLTPNPDVLCNREVKFASFTEAAIADGAAAVATGHYAQRRVLAGRVQLLRGCDATKDQGDFLALLTQQQLRRARFPLGRWRKRAVRELARRTGAPSADRADSQGICFIGERSMRPFLQTRIAPNPGPIVTTDGRVLGQHVGLPFYTIGQRFGLNLAAAEPYYVLAKQRRGNRLVVVPKRDEGLLYTPRLTARHAHWIAGTPPARRFRALVQIRHLQPLQRAGVHVEKDRLAVTFDIPQRAVTPGQYVVIGSGRRIDGAAVIAASA